MIANVVFPEALAPTMTMEASEVNLCIRAPRLGECESVSGHKDLGLAEASE